METFLKTSMYSVISAWSDNDRAVHYGDGFFTTMGVKNGCVYLKDYHIARLHRDSRRIGLPSIDIDIEQVIDNYAHQHANGVIKLVISAGVGGRGYARPNELNPNVFLSSSAIPEHYASWQQQGIVLGVSAYQLARQPLTAGVKHLNRLEQVFIKQHIPKTVDDVIVSDTLGNIVEVSSANIFWYRNGCWYTPSLEASGVQGVMRAFIIDTLNQHSQPVEIVSDKLQSLLLAEAVFICNALMQIVPVTAINNDGDITHFAIEPVKKLQQNIIAQASVSQ